MRGFALSEFQPSGNKFFSRLLTIYAVELMLFFMFSRFFSLTNHYYCAA